MNDSDTLTDGAQRVRIPILRPYSETRALMRVLDGTPKQRYTDMDKAIRSQTGTPQNPVNWQDPDTWIGERLEGAHRALARRIWDESDGTLNPRYVRGSHFLINGYDLLETDAEGVYHLTERGHAFLDEDPALLRRLDHVEGMNELLSILAPKSRAMRGDLLPEWKDFLREHSTFGSPSTFKDTLRHRLVNLIERGYVERDGNTYVITEAGTDYAARFAGQERDSPKREVQRALKAHNDQQREALRERLAVMDPYRFEELARDLLEAMGYQDVEVTQQSGDRGVDVIASVQYGITEVKEVVQVKRRKGTVSRPKIDQLRGALHHHDAIRGTLITLSQFSSGAKEAALLKGAPPITLIDGERLMDLLIEHEIGLKKKPALLYEVDERYFDEEDETSYPTD
jgi:restriction system protein